MQQLAIALARMHKAGVAHRDLKPSNILLRLRKSSEVKVSEEDLAQVEISHETMEFVIADFGFSRNLKDRVVSNLSMVGTPLYMSPQVLEDTKYTLKTDVWSLGALCFELLTGNPPFPSSSFD